MATNDFADYKKDSLVRPYEVAWENWAKFENVGDKVAGYIRDVFYRKAEGEFKEQRGITLEQADGVLINVAIKRLPFILEKTDGLRLGDPLTVELEKINEPRTKGYKGTKVFGFYGKNLEANLANKTVADLDNEDMVRQLVVSNNESDDFEEDEIPTIQA